MRELEELINSDDPAWLIVQSWLHEASNLVEVLPASDPDRGNALVATQATTQSTMGAIVYETGGMLIDRGWLRILGSGHPRLPRSLPGWNAGKTILVAGDRPEYLLIGDDVLGGFFAINGGALGVTVGNVCYYPPDQLKWEDLGRGYSEFIHWCLTGDLGAFYEGYRWPGWDIDVAAAGGDQAYSIYPPLWAEGPAIKDRDRRLVPIAELFDLHLGGNT
jgi:hypothetical protein